MSKQFLIFGLFILVVEYYSFVAMRSVLRNTSSGFQLGMYILLRMFCHLLFYGVFYVLPHWFSDGMAFRSQQNT